MFKIKTLLFGFLFVSLTGNAQLSRQAMDSLKRISMPDYQNMLDQLGIKSLRPKPNPDTANYDESKANPYPSLPDALTLKNGKKVTTAKEWWQLRRPEIMEDFDREILGRTPANLPKVKWEVVKITHDTIGNVPVITKKLIGKVDNSSFPSVSVNIDLTLITPANATRPVPVIMELAFVMPPGYKLNEKDWKELVLQKGWGCAVLIPVSIQADNGAGLRRGIIGLANKGNFRKPEDWGALKAWAWGAGRALDYFETDEAIDSKRIGIEGHSRYGKASLVAMAYDNRFKVAFISSSGEGGTKLHRHIMGEQVENIATWGEYHWMAGNFIKYAGPLTTGDLPVDAHELIALCAPRPVFVSNGCKGDEWADATGSFLGCVYAGPVYKLLGKQGLKTSQMPPVETALMNGDLAFRQHSGGHTPDPNWTTFLTFASRYFK
jgi:hypothetical protein